MTSALNIIGPTDAPHLAERVLGFIMSDGSRLPRFFERTGLCDELKTSSNWSHDLLRQVLNYAVEDEELLIKLHIEHDIRPASIMIGAHYMAEESMLFERA